MDTKASFDLNLVVNNSQQEKPEVVMSAFTLEVSLISFTIEKRSICMYSLEYHSFAWKSEVEILE